MSRLSGKCGRLYFPMEMQLQLEFFVPMTTKKECFGKLLILLQYFQGINNVDGTIQEWLIR